MRHALNEQILTTNVTPQESMAAAIMEQGAALSHCRARLQSRSGWQCIWAASGGCYRYAIGVEIGLSHHRAAFYIHVAERSGNKSAVNKSRLKIGCTTVVSSYVRSKIRLMGKGANGFLHAKFPFTDAFWS
jgi:hypothetical protein